MITYDCDNVQITNTAGISSVPAVKSNCVAYLTQCVQSTCDNSGNTASLSDSCGAIQPSAQVTFDYNPGASVWSGAASYNESMNPTLSLGQLFQLAELLDIRTQTMVDGGCGDACAQGTTTVTVTDGTGTQSTVILHA